MNELELFVEDVDYESDTRELRCLAALQGYRSSDTDIDRPSDKKLQSTVEKSVSSEPATYVRRSPRSRVCGFADWTIADFLLFMIALLLFLNFLIR